MSDKSHWCGQGGTNQSPAGGGKTHDFKDYRSEDQTKIQSGVCRKVFPFLRNLKKEILKIVLLDSKLQLIIDLTISKGSLNAYIVHPSEVMTSNIRESSTSFALIHNHLSR